MKKIISMILALAMVLALAGCAGTTVVVNNYNYYGTDSTEATADTTPIDEGEVEVVFGDGTVRTGLAITTTLGTSDATEENEGAAEFDITLAAILLDENDVIMDCDIDAIAYDFAFDTTGAITSDISAEVLTKDELGYDYGMVAYGGATYEWFEQVEAFEQYCIGKTVYEIQEIALNEDGYAGDADLATSATIYMGEYLSALLTAHANAQTLGAASTDDLVLSCTTSLSDTAQGNAQLNVDAVALTVNGEGVITSCQLDALQGKVVIDENGSVTDHQIETKNNLGFDYNMVAWGGATYEWFQQAANFAAYITGKTAEEVAGIAIDEATKPADVDLATSVTISIIGFKNLIAKALG